MVIPTAVLRSTADDWIIDANRNLLRAGIAVESFATEEEAQQAEQQIIRTRTRHGDSQAEA